MNYAKRRLKGVSSGTFFPCYKVLGAPQTLPQTLIFLKTIPFPVNKLSGIETHHRFTTTKLETHHRLPQPNIISPQLTITLPQPGRNSPSFYHNRHKKSMKIVRLWRYDGELRCRDGCREKLDENYKKRKLVPDSVDKKPLFRHESCHHWRLPLSRGQRSSLSIKLCFACAILLNTSNLNQIKTKT